MSAKSNFNLEVVKIYEKEKEMYKEWGKSVKEYIFKELGYYEEGINDVIKIPVNVRVKETESFIIKAFYRTDKKYVDPINEITDKVGIRFVVMLQNQIEPICNIIENSRLWDCSKDVDYEKNKLESPELFVYQSVHYVVRNKNEFQRNGIKIKEGIPCEIQIRTLEQHAYAELSHDYIYKKGKDIDPKIKRYLARSMALNEATDDLFSEVYGMIEKENEVYLKFTKYFMTYYKFKKYNKKLNNEVFVNLRCFIEKYNICEDDIASAIKPYIIQKISERQEKILFQQPMIILVYFLAKEHGRELLEKWYLPDNELDMVYSDLGISYYED